MFRYVCIHCLRTFLDEKKELDRFCWKCGGALNIVPDPEASFWHPSSVPSPEGLYVLVEKDGYISITCYKKGRFDIQKPMPFFKGSGRRLMDIQPDRWRFLNE